MASKCFNLSVYVSGPVAQFNYSILGQINEPHRDITQEKNEKCIEWVWAQHYQTQPSESHCDIIKVCFFCPSHETMFILIATWPRIAHFLGRLARVPWVFLFLGEQINIYPNNKPVQKKNKLKHGLLASVKPKVHQMGIIL